MERFPALLPILGNGIYYLNVGALEKSRFRELLPILTTAKGLIVDIRPVGYAKEPFDLIELIPHLAKEQYTSALWNIPQITSWPSLSANPPPAATGM